MILNGFGKILMGGVLPIMVHRILHRIAVGGVTL